MDTLLLEPRYRVQRGRAPGLAELSTRFFSAACHVLGSFYSKEVTVHLLASN